MRWGDCAAKDCASSMMPVIERTHRGAKHLTKQVAMKLRPKTSDDFSVGGLAEVELSDTFKHSFALKQ